MSKQVKEAVDFLVKSYGDIQAQAITYAQQLNLKDVQAELAKADKATVEHTVLSLLAQLLTQTVTIKDSKSTVTVDADSTKVE